jgi:hypothetical protein
VVGSTGIGLGVRAFARKRQSDVARARARKKVLRGGARNEGQVARHQQQRLVAPAFDRHADVLAAVGGFRDQHVDAVRTMPAHLRAADDDDPLRARAASRCDRGVDQLAVAERREGFHTRADFTGEGPRDPAACRYRGNHRRRRSHLTGPKLCRFTSNPAHTFSDAGRNQPKTTVEKGYS